MDISNLEKSNELLAILHLKEASTLLKVNYEEISNILLELSKNIFESSGLLSSDIESIESLKKESFNEG